jgi:hypothetical protein
MKGLHTRIPLMYCNFLCHGMARKVRKRRNGNIQKSVFQFMNLSVFQFMSIDSSV